MHNIIEWIQEGLFTFIVTTVVVLIITILSMGAFGEKTVVRYSMGDRTTDITYCVLAEVTNSPDPYVYCGTDIDKTVDVLNKLNDGLKKK